MPPTSRSSWEPTRSPSIHAPASSARCSATWPASSAAAGRTDPSPLHPPRMSFAKKRLRPRLLAVYALAGVALWLSRPTPASIAAGALPILLGEGLRLWATGHLHKNDSLTVTGPYAYLRHPLYAGTLLIGAGFLIMAWSGIALAFAAVFLVGYFGYYM